MEAANWEKIHQSVFSKMNKGKNTNFMYESKSIAASFLNSDF